MSNWWKYIIVVIIGSVVCYHLTISLTPNVIYAGAKRKIYNRNGAAANELRVSPVITAEMRSVVMPNPDFLYLTAFYDLSDGPIRLHGDMPDSTYWSVSMYHPNTVNWYVKNDMDYGSSSLDIKIRHAVSAASHHNPDEMILCDKKEGFLLMRVLITDRTEERIDEYQNLLGKIKLEKL